MWFFGISKLFADWCPRTGRSVRVIVLFQNALRFGFLTFPEVCACFCVCVFSPHHFVEALRGLVSTYIARSVCVDFRYF